jgi:hypothetical protein
MKEWEMGTGAGYRRRKKKSYVDHGNASSSARGESSVEDA